MAGRIRLSPEAAGRISLVTPYSVETIYHGSLDLTASSETELEALALESAHRASAIGISFAEACKRPVAARLFVVVRTGVYDRGVVDVKPTLEEARAAAERAAGAEADSYHDFEIRTRPVDSEDYFSEIVATLASPDSNTFRDRTPRVWTTAAGEIENELKSRGHKAD